MGGFTQYIGQAVGFVVLLSLAVIIVSAAIGIAWRVLTWIAPGFC